MAAAIAAVVLFAAVPAWARWMAERELQGRADALVQALERARSEAVGRGRRIVVCPTTGLSCTTSTGRWEDGWTTLALSDLVGDAAAALAREPRAPEGITVRGNRPVEDYVSYTTSGYARTLAGALQMGTFTICRRGHAARKVVLAGSGRVRAQTTSQPCP